MKLGPSTFHRLLTVIVSTLSFVLASCTVSDAGLGRLNHAVDGGAGCALASPLVQVQGRPTCTGRLAASYLTNALCSCGDAQLASSLTTRAFDSRQGPFQDGQADQGGASVGVNGSYMTFVGADIGGSFAMAGSAEMTFTGTMFAGGDLWAAGNIRMLGVASVARNAFFGGNYAGTGPLTVAGAMHHAGTVTAIPLKFGSDQAGPVTVPKPCACESETVLDIGALVDAARVDNDNGSLGLLPDAYAAVAGMSELTLPCGGGRAYLSGIGGTGSLLVHVKGMSAIFIDGSVALLRDLVFDVASRAEIDVFVKNDVQVSGRLVLASKDRPSAGRLWVGGSQTISLASPWVGNLYAPHAPVSARVVLDAWGSIFAATFSGDFATTITFDRSIVDTGKICDAPPPPAGTCRQCGVCYGGNACVAGACGACVADSDCCSLSICANGTCQPWLDVQSP